MNYQFNPAVAKNLSVDEAIILGWIEHHYQYTPLSREQLEAAFSFWLDEHLYQLLAQLEARTLLQVKRDPQGNCLFAINTVRYLELIGLNFKQNLPATPNAILDKNLTHHLTRFQSDDSLLNKKLTKLISESHAQIIDYAVSEGLALDEANASFDKFLHYVSSQPNKYWNSDLIAYWRFWVSNHKDRQKSTQKGQGKRSAVERSNEHTGANWLKSKQADSARAKPLFSSTKITYDK